MTASYRADRQAWHMASYRAAKTGMAYDIIITGLIDRHGVWRHTGLLRQAWHGVIQG